MSEDEKVDGPRIAAEILRRLNPAHREKLMKAIAASDPVISKKISVNIITFDEIAELTDQSVQILIKEVDHYDLVVSLKKTNDKVKETLLSNMSARKRQVVEEDFANLPPKKVTEVDEAQQRILSKIEELRTAGSIRMVAKEGVLSR